jgi:hypothetical protein
MSNIIERYEVENHGLTNRGQLTVKHDTELAGGVNRGTVAIKSKQTGSSMLISTKDYMEYYVDTYRSINVPNGLFIINNPLQFQQAFENFDGILGIVREPLTIDSDITITVRGSESPQKYINRVIGQKITISDGAILTFIFPDNNTILPIIENDIDINDGTIYYYTESFTGPCVSSDGRIVISGYIQNTGSPALITNGDAIGPYFRMRYAFLENVDPNCTINYSYDVKAYKKSYAKYGKIKTVYGITSLSQFPQTAITNATYYNAIYDIVSGSPSSNSSGEASYIIDIPSIGVKPYSVLLHNSYIDSSGNVAGISGAFSSLQQVGGSTSVVINYGFWPGTLTTRVI